MPLKPKYQVNLAGMIEGQLEEHVDALRFHRAVDLWAGALLPGTDIIPAINAALADGQLDEDELFGLLLHLGYVLPRGVVPCHVQLAANQGGGLNVVTFELGARIELACIRALGGAAATYPTAARIAAENKPHLTPEEADAAFDGIDDL